MAAVDFDATATPQDVVAAVGLMRGRAYTAQNASTVATVYVREAATAPAPTGRAFRVEAGGNFTVKPTGSPIWCWTDDPAGCPVILAESV